MNIKFSRVVNQQVILRLISVGVFVSGLLILLGALTSQVTITRRSIIAHDIRIGLPLIVGFTLVYLASLLNRRKQAAWLVTMFVYAFFLGVNLANMLDPVSDIRDYSLTTIVRNLILPLVVIIGLAYYRRAFNVKSDTRSFTLALRVVVSMLLLAFLYGIVGFLLFDKHDFHEEINLLQSAHYTIDQVGLTTNHIVHAYTVRGRVFLDSLSLVSTISIFYAIISFFQPLRARFSDQSKGRELMQRLLTNNKADSEDFFKLWPHDKTYFFTQNESAGLAYRVEKGVALVIRDPIGKSSAIRRLLTDFEDLCRTNDWLPAWVHVLPSNLKLYRSNGYTIQKIGEEAIIDLQHFESDVANNKYFRHITNKFTKLGYTRELYQAPHHEALISRLQQISRDWLALPGRSERGFMMGYFSEEYLQQCNLMVMRDAAGTIQAFMNQVPSFDSEEANYDLLRYSQVAPGNSNDFLLMGFINYVCSEGFKRLNLGLCPLAGLEDHDGDKTVIDTAMRFVYSNGDRFYSFSGLQRFKAKYEPNWEDRYVAYRGGIRGFSRTANALNKALGHSVKNLPK
jgi:phosphatidylglycerol lysyltransferase